MATIPDWYEKVKVDQLIQAVYTYVDNKPVPTQYTDEQARDAVAAMISAGTQSGITFTYNDAADSLSATVTAGGAAAYTDEQAQDAVAAMIAAGTHSGISFSYNDAGNSLSATVSGGSGTTDAATPYGTVWLDSFAGANDDAKLGSAMSAVSADTYPRAIQLAARAHTFSTQRTAFDGLKILGPQGYSNPERGSGSKSAMRVTLSMTGAWITSNGTNYQVSLHNLAFGGGSSAQVLAGTFYCLSMRDISSSGLKTLLGSQASPLVITAANFSGDWEINNCYNGAIHIQGSDNTLWTDGMLLDSGTAFNSAGSANGQYHLWCDQLEKSYIGPLYITCEGGWGGIKISGNGFNSTSNNQGGPIIINGAKIEGRNAGAPCNGANIRQDGGIVVLDNCWVAYGMANTASFGNSDIGVIHHTAGTLNVRGTTYDRATGVAETVPFIYTASTGDCYVAGQMRASKGGTWTGRPRLALKSGNTENRINDTTVTQITV